MQIPNSGRGNPSPTNIRFTPNKRATNGRPYDRYALSFSVAATHISPPLGVFSSSTAAVKFAQRERGQKGFPITENLSGKAGFPTTFAPPLWKSVKGCGKPCGNCVKLGKIGATGFCVRLWKTTRKKRESDRTPFSNIFRFFRVRNQKSVEIRRFEGAGAPTAGFLFVGQGSTCAALLK